MKLKFIFVLALGTISNSIAQPVLNQENFALVNESFIYTTLNDPTIDFSNTGANYTWDYSYLSSTTQRWLTTSPVTEAGQLSNMFFGSFAPAAYKATYFADATDLPVDQWTQAFPITIDKISVFTKNSATSINTLGYEFMMSGQGIPAKSDTIEHRYELPLAYGDSYESRGYTDLNMNPIYDAQWRQHRHRVSNVDGWGTVITPYGTFEALRIHHRIEEIDSFYVTINSQGTWIPIPVPPTHTYEWRTLAERESVMTITTSEVAGNEVVTNVEYRDYYNGLGLENNEIVLNVFPNPVVNQLSFELSSNPNYVSVIDSKGLVVYQSELNSNKGSIDMSTFASGSYYVVFNTENGVKAEKFIKK